MLNVAMYSWNSWPVLLVAVPLVVVLVSVVGFTLWSYVIGKWLHARQVKHLMEQNRGVWSALDTKLVWCVGSSGAGKSTLAKRLADGLGNTCVDLDDLYWLPGWKKRSGEEVRGMLSKLFAAGPVVVAGVYESDMGPLMRSEATTLVWVRPPYYRLMWQLCSRSLINVCLGRCNCGNGNTETIYSNFLAPNSIVRKTHRSYHRVEARYKALMLNPPPQLDIVVLTNRAEAAAFIRVMSEARTGPPMAATESMFASLARKLAGSMSQKLAEYRARKAAARHATNLAARQAKLASAMRFRQRASEKVAQLLARQAKELEEARREEEEAVRAEAEALAAQQQLDAEEALAAEEAKRNGGSVTAAGDREPSTPPAASQLHQRKNAAAAAAAAAASGGSDAQSTGEASMAR